MLSMQQVWQAAEMADLKSDIEALPMALHTHVDEGGNTFSGGQRQRLLIARALIQNPRLLFLDEATGSLDTDTRNRIMQRLKERPGTCLLIAHRESTIRYAERVIVLDNGDIAFDGTQAAYQAWRKTS